MGDKLATSVATYIQPECTGFINDTARSFIRRHSDPASLLCQVKSLYTNGDHAACKNLISLICEEMHELSEMSDLFVLLAKIAFEEDDRQGLSQSIKQAEIINSRSPDLAALKGVLSAQELLKDGCYQEGERALGALTSGEKVNAHASFVLGSHQVFKGNHLEAAIFNLQTAVEVKPSFVKAWAALGFAYNRMGQKTKAHEAFAKCIELETNPDRLAFYKQQLAS